MIKIPDSVPAKCLHGVSSRPSQEQVAERMGVDRAYISGLELGERNPTAITLWRIAEALNVEVHRLLMEPGT